MSGARRAALAAVLGAATLSCAPELGDAPARCDDGGGCPEGYDCIRGVCATAGSTIPIEVVRVGNLRGIDLRVVPQATGVLVAWQTYAYSPEGEGFWAARVDPRGDVSPPMRLVAPFEADEGLVEPYFDILATGDTSVLVAVSAGPVDDAIEPRLITFDVSLPPEGREDEGTSFRAAWSREVRMPTVGFGAVSRPRFVRVGDEVWLGYVQSRVATLSGAGGGAGGGGEDGAGGGAGEGGAGGRGGAGGGAPAGEGGSAPGGGDAGGDAIGDTVAELAVFRLGVDGAPLASPTCSDSSCCQADACLPARASLPVAVGVVDAFTTEAGAWFVVDDVRPSVIEVAAGDTGLETAVQEQLLPTLAVPVEAAPGSLLYVVPSARGGDELPSDPVVGNASLARLTVGAGDVASSTVAELPPVRDVPRPSWIRRDGARSLLVTPGSAVDAGSILVLAVDPASGAHQEVARIDRRSTLELAAVAAAEVGGTLFVFWVDAGDDAAVIRGEALPAPG